MYVSNILIFILSFRHSLCSCNVYQLHVIHCSHHFQLLGSDLKITTKISRVIFCRAVQSGWSSTTFGSTYYSLQTKRSTKPTRSRQQTSNPTQECCNMEPVQSANTSLALLLWWIRPAGKGEHVRCKRVPPLNWVSSDAGYVLRLRT
jgi:hypothetical protein